MAECMTPYHVKNPKYKGGTTRAALEDLSCDEYIPVPCGRCPACYARRSSAWSFRLMQEEKVSSSALFVTLTYAPEHIKLTPNGYMNLDKRDTQLFFKRLRKLNHEKLKYYICGEYGGKSWRPHYHIILFNCDCETISKAWSLGSYQLGTVSGASIGYTLKYINKPSRIPLHRNDDRQKEFGNMSKGLGLSYLTESMVQWHLQDLGNRMHCVTYDNVKLSMPRYYKDKIYGKDTIIRQRATYFARLESIKRQAKAPFISEHDKTQRIIAAFRLQQKKSMEGQSL